MQFRSLFTRDEDKMESREVLSHCDPANSPNDIVAETYRGLKDELCSSPEGRRRFKLYRRNFRQSIRKDRRRSRIWLLRKAKHISMLAVMYGIYLGIASGGVGLTFPKMREGEAILDYISVIVSGNIQAFMTFIPEAWIVATACLIGIILTILGYILMFYDDRKTLRRMMVHAIQEDMTEKEVISFKNMIVGNRFREYWYGYTSMYSVKDAIRFTPMSDYMRPVNEQERISD